MVSLLLSLWGYRNGRIFQFFKYEYGIQQRKYIKLDLNIIHPFSVHTKIDYEYIYPYQNFYEIPIQFSDIHIHPVVVYVCMRPVHTLYPLVMELSQTYIQGCKWFEYFLAVFEFDLIWKGFYLSVSESRYLISVIDPYSGTKSQIFMISISNIILSGKN